MAPPPPRPPPPSGPNALPLPPPPPQALLQNSPQANVNMVQGQGQGGRPEYQEHQATYVVFVTEPNDKKSRNRRQMEVNAVMPAVPKYMYWSEQSITWSIADHPKIMPSPGAYTLVLDPIFIGPDIPVKFSRV